MKSFVATTVTGTRYISEGDGVIKIHPLHDQAYAIKAERFKVVDRPTLKAFTDIDALPYAALPEVGKSIYIGGFLDWRLSTAVKTVEAL